MNRRRVYWYNSIMMHLMLTIHWKRLLYACVAIAAFAASTNMNAQACTVDTVREAAFFTVRDNYWMGMVFEEGDAESHIRYTALAAWIEEQGGDLNVQLEHVLPEDAMYLKMRYGVTEPLVEMPATFFSGRHPTESRAVVLTQWTPAPDVSVLEGLHANTTLAQIARDTPEFWAALVYARGTGAPRRDAVENVVAQWRTHHGPGVALHELDRHDPDNALLCAVADIAADGEDWVGVVFGRGRLLLPALQGDAITARKLDRLLSGLQDFSTCPLHTAAMGIDLPMRWDETYTERYAHLEASGALHEPLLANTLPFLFSEMPSGARIWSTTVLNVFTGLGLVAVFLLSFCCLHLLRRQ